MSFRQQIRATPQINLNYWSFAITGKVRRPLILSFADLQQFPPETIRSALTCTGTHAGRPMMREASWRGVPLRTLLQHIEADASARYAHTFASDGYSSVLPLDALSGALLAFEMDGAPLTPEDGYPARLIVPGRHSFKMPKWISRIELCDTAEGGFWEAHGWSLDGSAEARVAITSHSQAEDGSVEIAGVAHGGEKAITSVLVSIDGAGEMVIPLTQGEGHALAHWRANWMPPGAGDYRVNVRLNAAGQPAKHAITVKVR